MIRKMATAAAALALVATPVVAQAADPVFDRATAPVGESSELMGAGGGVLAVLAVALIAAGIYIAVDEDDDEPLSA